MAAQASAYKVPVLKLAKITEYDVIQFARSLAPSPIIQLQFCGFSPLNTSSRSQ